ncbi:MAG: 4-hydroxy-tetrahydrodipicolinate reductase, partial [Steroidobacteraceae bacterium]
LTLGAAIAARGSASLGRDAGELADVAPLNVAVTADLPRALESADVALDFSVPGAAGAHLAACRAARKPLLIGTTALAPELTGELEAAAHDIALLIAPNTSIAVTLLIELVRTAAATLAPDFDVDIFEAHHRDKRDAPSGTALALRQAARESPAPAAREIAVSVVRAGDLVGEHTVLFTGAGEQLALTHRASDRAIFARGALAAALWLASQPAGLYGMRDFIQGKTNSYGTLRKLE